MTRKRRREPQRERRRTKPTVSSGPVRVAVVTTPQSSGDQGASLRHEIDLAKSALLYADEVEMISLSVSMLDGIRTAGDDGMVELLDSLGPELLTHLGGGELPSDWKETVRLGMALDPDFVAALDPEAGEQLRAVQSEMAQVTARSQADVEALLEQTGASELRPGVKSGVLKVAKLDGISPATTLRPAALGDMNDTDEQIWTWMSVVMQRLQNPRVRVLFDEEVGSLLQSMIDEGLIEASSKNLRLAAQASFGAGFIGRLPAFPQARMDELLDLRSDLSPHLVRYRGAITRVSADMPREIGLDLEFDVQQAWDAEVQPELLNIQEELATHGLVKELARAVQATDIRNFGQWTAGTWVALDTGTDLSTIGTGLAAVALNATPRVGQAVMDSLRAKANARDQAKKSEFYLLYETNQRLEDFRNQKT